ncbi:MAG: FecR domain-containing protein [Candidatus Binatia bacterium]
MPRKILFLLFPLIAVTVSEVSFPLHCWAQTREQAVATVVSVQGAVEAQRKGATQWHPVQLNERYAAGDTIRVLERSRADIAMLDQSVLRLNENTTITLQAIKEEQTGVLNLLKGAAHFFSRGPRSLEVATPFATAGVRGTEFFIDVENNQMLVSVFEGTVVAENQGGSLTLTGGQSAVAETGKAPALRVIARPRDAVQWALHYPPVLYLRPDELPPGPDWQAVRQSLEFYQKGDIQRAFQSIAAVPRTLSDPRLFTYRASLLLAVGRVDEAAADIHQALRLHPQESNALALQTIIALVQNESGQALTTAQQAVAVAPHAATPLLALSYAQQAKFDLEGARTSLEKAVALEPRNALAWARLAELHSSFGHLQKALSAAQEAVTLEPNLSRTQTILGFVYLMQVATTQAKEAFAKAIVLDQADPLPRLGLGLAKIREGALYEGSREVEIAASLDPNDSLIRSYLGKAYFEEKRTDLDKREYATAQELDPQDPTPFFYGAIQKQTTNRPVEALHDLQKAIALNDNRAVYRSRLLLDADLAARSASLARVYTDLGFQELALVEGWKSVNTDPSNFSAHRFLADSYSVLPRHEIARVSELLQSQLLQPLNMTPIQPQLAESNLFLLSAAGPGALSFNEFNPLFNRNGITAQAGSVLGEQETYAGEGVISGIYQNAAFSVGGLHFTTAGWRKNADQKDDIANAFGQIELTPHTSIQGEYRYRNTERGDLRQFFFPNDFFPNQRTSEERHVYRLGGRHSFSPASILLASFIYQDVDSDVEDPQVVGVPGLSSFLSQRPEDAFAGELQHLFRSQPLNLISGVGHFDISGRIDFTGRTGLPPPFDGFTSRTSTDLRHTNVYAYSYLNLLKTVTFMLGASGDFTDGESPDVKGINQFNPKFGVTWEPIRGTILRAAAFRVLKRTLITNQTLEPTQVAGFNQFFDDFNGTRSWRYGGAIDQTFSLNLFGGVELSRRDLDVPAIDQSGKSIRVDWEENLLRTYLFWTPHPWFALRLEHQYERIRRAALLTNGAREMDTHRVPLGLSFFHPCGLSAALTATYYNQDGVFERIAGGFPSGSDNFWTVDAGINYRLPKRYGFVSIGATNLFDQRFRYYELDFNNPHLRPDRMFFARVTLALS